MYRMKPQYNAGLFYHPTSRQLRGGTLIDDSEVSYSDNPSTNKLKASSDFAEQFQSHLGSAGKVPTLKSGSKADREKYRQDMVKYNATVKGKEQDFRKSYKDEISQNLDQQFLQAGYTKDKSGKWRKPASLKDVPWLDKAISWIPGATDFSNKAISAGEQVYNKPNLENIINAGKTLADSATAGYNMGKQLADPKKLIKDLAISQGKKALGMGLPKDYNKINNHYNSWKMKGRGAGGAPKKINKGDEEQKDVAPDNDEETKEDTKPYNWKSETQTFDFDFDENPDIIKDRIKATMKDLEDEEEKQTLEIERVKIIRANKPLKEALNNMLDEIKAVQEAIEPDVIPLNDKEKKIITKENIVIVEKKENEKEEDILERNINNKYTIDEFRNKVKEDEKRKEEIEFAPIRLSNELLKDEITKDELIKRIKKLKEDVNTAQKIGVAYENYDQDSINNSDKAIVINTGNDINRNRNFDKDWYTSYSIEYPSDKYIFDQIIYNKDGTYKLRELKNYSKEFLRRYNDKGEEEILYPIQVTKLGHTKVNAERSVDVTWVRNGNRWKIEKIQDNNKSLKLVKFRGNSMIKDEYYKEIGEVKNITDYKMHILTTNDKKELEEMTFDFTKDIGLIADFSNGKMTAKDDFLLYKAEPQKVNYPKTKEGIKQYNEDYEKWKNTKEHFKDPAGTKTLFVPRTLLSRRFTKIK